MAGILSLGTVIDISRCGIYSCSFPIILYPWLMAGFKPQMMLFLAGLLPGTGILIGFLSIL